MDEQKTAELTQQLISAGISGVTPNNTPAKMGVMQTIDAPQMIDHVQRSLDFNPMDVRWMPISAKFAVCGLRANGIGQIVMHELTPTGLNVLQTIDRPTGVKCCTFSASPLENRRLAVGEYSGHCSLIDIEMGVATWQVQAHDTLVNCIDGCGGAGIGYGAPEIATGSRDGTVKIFDPRVREAVVSLEPSANESGRDCWTVAFGNNYIGNERCIAAGYDNGDVKLFDLRTNTMRWETNIGNGVVNIEFDRKDIEMNKMVVTSLESKFKVFDMRTQNPKSGFANITEKAHKATVWLTRHLPQNRDIWMTSGGNGGLNLYRYHYPLKRVDRDADNAPRGVMGNVELMNARILSTQPIVGFDWSPDKEGLAAMVALDQTVRVMIVTKLGNL